MNRFPIALAVTCATLSVAVANAAAPAVTIYNQNFGVVREQIELDLKKGENDVSFSNVTALLEPQSVVLRDANGKIALSILEQSYRADPISQGLLLDYFEGKEISFRRQIGDTVDFPKGKIIRSGYAPVGGPIPYNQHGAQYFGATEPVIEVDGVIQFGLPGQPMFPSLPDDSILKPTLDWKLHSPKNAKINAELGYVTQGMSWAADYNVISREDNDKVEVVGWISMNNQTGRSFQDAKIKLIAGDVNKIEPNQPKAALYGARDMVMAMEMAPQVEEKAFADFHLYTLPRQTTLLDQQTKQVEFMRAANVTAKPIYLYDGAQGALERYRGWDKQAIRQDQAFGTDSNAKVWIVREIENTEDNGLGIALPKGKIRFYKQDTDGQLEFTGENELDHTPKKETLRLYTGNAFDVTGQRKRTDYKYDNRSYVDEAFEITLKNRKEKAVTVRVVEHLYRWNNWEITSKSHDFKKVDADTITFDIELPADSEKSVSYRVHYTW